MPQALKLLEQFKPENAPDMAPSDTGGGAGVAVMQTGGEPVFTCYNCREKGHTVNDCHKLDKAGKDRFWEAFNKERRGNNTKEGFMNAAVTGQRAAVASEPTPAPVPSPAPAASMASAPANVTWPW